MSKFTAVPGQSFLNPLDPTSPPEPKMSIFVDEKHPLPTVTATTNLESSSENDVKHEQSSVTAHILMQQSVESGIDQQFGTNCRRKILIAVDDSPEASHALEYALKNVLQDGDHVYLLHVIKETDVIDSFYLDITSKTDYLKSELLDEAFRTAEKFLNGIIRNHQALLEGKIIEFLVEIKVGDPRDVIIDVAESINVALIIIGSHGKGMLKRMFLGSVSEYVMQHCKIPVLIVKTLQKI